MQENKTKTRIITEEEMNIQREYERKVKEIILSRTAHPKALVRTFGCQQNVADSQRIKGMLRDMGYDFTEDENEADFVLFNTCAVREHAEDRVIGNVGALNQSRKNAET